MRLSGWRRRHRCNSGSDYSLQQRRDDPRAFPPGRSAGRVSPPVRRSHPGPRAGAQGRPRANQRGAENSREQEVAAGVYGRSLRVDAVGRAVNYPAQSAGLVPAVVDSETLPLDPGYSPLNPEGVEQVDAGGEPVPGGESTSMRDRLTPTSYRDAFRHPNAHRRRNLKSLMSATE